MRGNYTEFREGGKGGMEKMWVGFQQMPPRNKSTSLHAGRASSVSEAPQSQTCRYKGAVTDSSAFPAVPSLWSFVFGVVVLKCG